MTQLSVLPASDATAEDAPARRAALLARLRSRPDKRLEAWGLPADSATWTGDHVERWHARCRELDAAKAGPPRPRPLSARDAVFLWLAARTVAGGRTRTRVLHDDYRAWCEAHGWTPADEMRFGTVLTESGRPSHKSCGNMVRALSLRP